MSGRGARYPRTGDDRSDAGPRPYTPVVMTEARRSRGPVTALADAGRRHGELVRFAAVGATTFVVDTAVFLALKSTVLEPKPVTAKVIAVVVATVVGYLLNREWSFRARGGLGRPREATLYFLVSGVGLAVNAAPLFVSRYVLDLAEPAVSALTEQVADLVSAQVVGTLLALVFRFWAFRRWVFPSVVSEELP